MSTARLQQAFKSEGIVESLLFSLQSVLPLFLLILLGYFLRRKDMINDSFVNIGTKIVFKISLPLLLFTQIASADLTTVFNPKLILYSLGTTVLIIALLILLVPRFVKDRPSAGAMIQGIYRGNLAILGVSLAVNMFGQEGAAPTSLLLPFTIPLYNALAVVILTVYSKDSELQKPSAKKIIKDIITNPLILGILLGLPFSLLHIQLPTLVTKCLSPITSLNTPLALICLGGQCTIQTVKDNLKLSLISTFIKLVIIPTLVILGAIAIGLRGYDLGAVFIVYMSPSAVASYVMAKQMHSNDELAGQILIMTTIFSCITLFLGIYILRALALI